jgi:two-component system, OmpR family, response regulator
MPTALNRILYVEDKFDIRFVAEMALQAVGGFSVISCASGEEALRAAPRARADLLLLDVMMPGMDGPGTLMALRALAARIPQIWDAQG